MTDADVRDLLPYLRRVAGKLLRRARVHDRDTLLDDLCQEGLIRILRVAPQFDPNRGASFRTWALACAKNGMRTYLFHKEQRLSFFCRDGESAHRGRMIWIEDWTGLEPAISGPSPEDACFRSEVLQHRLDPVISLVCQGYTAAEIARKAGTTAKRVHNHKMRFIAQARHRVAA